MNVLDEFLEISDPSDFPVESLRKLDSSLRCSICKEFFDAPVTLLHCGHTFCSLCVRNVLPTKAECPTCRAAAKESHLVRNATFEEVVNSWSEARALVLKCANVSVKTSQNAFSSKGKKRKLSCNSDLDRSSEAGPSKLPRRGSSESSSTPSGKECEDGAKISRKGYCHAMKEEVVSSSDPEEQELPNPARTNPPVKCPSCSRRVAYNSINLHLDSGCKKHTYNDSKDAAPGRAKVDSKMAWGSIFNGQGKKASGTYSVMDSEIPTTKIAKISYGVFNLTGLRKLLAERGLPTQGEKQELIDRHEKWIAIYNANLDRTHPKTVGELKQQLKEVEEVASRPGPKIQDVEAWTQRNKAQFASLIETARPQASKNTEEATAGPSSPSSFESPPVPSSSLQNHSASDVIVID